MLSTFLLRTLFPSECLSCGRSIAGWDGPLHSRIPPGWPERAVEFLTTEHVLRRCCFLGLPAEVLCRGCWLSLRPAEEVPALRIEGLSVTAPFITEETLLGVVRFLKFGKGRNAAVPLGWWMAEALERMTLSMGLDASKDCLLVPVPLHRRRRLERGYDQASLLASVVGSMLGVPVDEGLVRRRRHTRPQSSLGRRERTRNMMDAFQSERRRVPSGRRIVLVDDLVTTGSTVRACAEALAPLSTGGILALSAGVTPDRPGAALRAHSGSSPANKG